jgi:broad specificity phosphatase PhoE
MPARDQPDGGAPATLYFVRHGQSTWNVEHRVQGQTAHVPLTPEGRRQARMAAGLLRQCGARLVFTSDLARAAQTAAPIARALGTSARAEPALREQFFGVMEGRLAAELTAEPTPAGGHVSQVRWGGGESVADMYARVGGFLRQVLAAHPGQDIVLVTHGGPVRVAVAWLRGLGPQRVEWHPVPNGSVTTVGCAGRHAREVTTTVPA